MMSFSCFLLSLLAFNLCFLCIQVVLQCLYGPDGFALHPFRFFPTLEIRKGLLFGEELGKPENR